MRAHRGQQHHTRRRRWTGRCGQRMPFYVTGMEMDEKTKEVVDKLRARAMSVEGDDNKRQKLG
eukprot:12780346-Heterocapsa_arctica.AAC.1